VYGFSGPICVPLSLTVYNKGPLSVEWEDPGMNRDYGAAEARQFIKKLDFESPKAAFDSAFKTKA
jgi:hypothetical protein